MHGDEKDKRVVPDLEQGGANYGPAGKIKRLEGFFLGKLASRGVVLDLRELAQIMPVEWNLQRVSDDLGGLAVNSRETRAQGFMPVHEGLKTLMQRLDIQVPG